MKKLVVLVLSVLTGCSGTTYLGHAGNVDFYSVHASHLDGPNFTALVSVHNGHTQIDKVIGGSGVLQSVAPALIDAGGAVGSSAVFRPSNCNTNVSTTGGNANSAATGGTEDTSVDDSDRVNVNGDYHHFQR